MAPSHVVIAGALALLGSRHAPTVGAFTPYTPASGWTYNLEAARQQSWPECTARFVSGGAKEVALATSVGVDAEVSLESSSTRDGAFYLKLSGGRYMSYAGSCSELQVDTFATAGINQEFRMVSSLASVTTFEWQLEAVGRKACTTKMVSFSYADCRKPSLTMGAVGNSSIFRLHAVRNNGEQRYDKKPNSAIGCADPFAWYASTAGTYQLACTGGNLALLRSSGTLSPASLFSQDGVVLGGRIPDWARSGNRWAPENLELAAATPADDTNSSAQTGATNVVFFSDSTGESGQHRVGWAMSSARQRLDSSWTQYPPSYLNLGDSPSGEIDQHIFKDVDGTTYLLWKTDDNSVGSRTTRLWGQQIAIRSGSVSLLGTRRQLMNSSGLWWVQSFIAGGSLIEGPELIHWGDYYYLFFAAGKYCQASYSEGVARSKSIFGPYEKMPVPLLSTGLTQDTQGQKQIGPGHASFVTVSHQQTLSSGNTSKACQKVLDGCQSTKGDPTQCHFCAGRQQPQLRRASCTKADINAYCGGGGGGQQASRYFAVYHASPGNNCNRHAYVEEMKFDPVTLWPYIDFDAA